MPGRYCLRQRVVAPALLDRSQSLGDIVQNVFFRTMRLIRGVRRKLLPRVRGSWVRDHSPDPGVDRRDKCRWPNVSELTCRAAATGQVGGPSVKIAERIRKMLDAIHCFAAVANA